MALVLNEEQQMLKEAASGFLQSKAPVSQLRELRDTNSKTGFDESVWNEMVEMGWAGVAIPENYGGIGYGYTGLGIVLEEVGRNLSASPLNASVLTAATVILKLGSEAQKNELLPAIAGGELKASLALEENGHHKTSGFSTTATQSGGNWELSGQKCFVADAGTADKFLVAAETGTGSGVFIVDANASGVDVERVTMVDSRSSGKITLKGAVALQQLSPDSSDASHDELLSAAIDIANIGISAELLGLSLQAFEVTVNYLKERKQFGSVIGTFQGLQHRAAHLFCELELGRSMVLAALQAVDAEQAGLPAMASATKAKLVEVAQLATNEAIQMHGGIGMTDEYDIGFYIKRARALEHTFGDRHYHLDRFAALNCY